MTHGNGVSRGDRNRNAKLARLRELVPGPYRDRVVGFASEYDRLLARYLRGQVLAAAIVGVLTWLGFLIAGFPYALLLGVVAGVFNIIPYMGLVASLIPALIIAIFSASPGIALLKIVVVFAVVQMLDSSVIGPRVVGEAVGLHPVWVLLALAIAGYFFGFDLAEYFPYNLMRTWHVQLAIFWVAMRFWASCWRDWARWRSSRADWKPRRRSCR